MNTLTKGRKDMKHKIGIICAGEAEINPVLSYLTNEKTTEKALSYFNFVGTLSLQEVK